MVELDWKAAVGILAGIVVLLPFLPWTQLVAAVILVFCLCYSKKISIILRTLPRDLG
jgi:hypothetical protein